MTKAQTMEKNMEQHQNFKYSGKFEIIRKEMTDNQKRYGNQLYKFLLKNDIVTKEQMLAELNWDSSKDRQLRDLISCIAKKVPIIATSDQKGYYLAKTEADLDAVEHQWAELSSRIEELEKRIAPLIAFRDKILNKK